MEFPPPLQIGNRVWSRHGYYDHGPLQGPKVNIARDVGGTIVSIERPYLSGSMLFVVKWDNGQLSKHYGNKLFCIGRNANLSDFVSSIAVEGPVTLTLGPQGGFRHAEMTVFIDTVRQRVKITDRDLWLECLEPLVCKCSLEVETTRLPRQPRR